MKKTLIALLFLGILQATTLAQWESSSAIGLRYVIPQGTTADIYDNGYGVTGTSNFSVLPILDIMSRELSYFILNNSNINNVF